MMASLTLGLDPSVRFRVRHIVAAGEDFKGGIPYFLEWLGIQNDDTWKTWQKPYLLGVLQANGLMTSGDWMNGPVRDRVTTLVDDVVATNVDFQSPNTSLANTQRVMKRLVGAVKNSVFKTEYSKARSQAARAGKCCLHQVTENWSC